MKGSTPKLTTCVERDDLREGDGLHARATKAAALTLRCLLVAPLCVVASLVPASVSWGQTVSSGEAVVIYKGGPQSIPNANDQRYNFSQKIYDPDGLVTTGTDWRFKAPVSGIYNLSLSVVIDFPPNEREQPIEQLQLGNPLE